MVANNDFLIEQILEEIDEHLSEAFKVGDRYVNDIQYFKHPDNKDLEMEASHIKHNLKCAWLYILSIFEKYDHPTMLSEAKDEYAQYLKTPLKQKMGLEEPYLYWLYPIQNYVDVLRSFYVKKDLKGIDSKQKHVIEIIKRAENFVTNRDIFGFVPCKEKDIHDRLEALLKCSFRDVKRMPSISKSIKNFEPDTSVPSLNVLIEYKYVNSKDDCKHVVDEIFADIGGYQSPKRDLILFVIYETSRFFSNDDWNRAIKESRPPSTVRHILIKGIEPSQYDIDLRGKYESHVKSFKKKSKKRPADRNKPITKSSSQKKSK